MYGRLKFLCLFLNHTSLLEVLVVEQKINNVYGFVSSYFYNMFLCLREFSFLLFFFFLCTKFDGMFAKIKTDECLHQIVVSIILKKQESDRIASISQHPQLI